MNGFFLRIRKFEDSKIFLPDGYTLVEILVALTIMAVIISFGLASWTNYREAKSLDQAGLSLVSFLRGVRAKATSGKKPIVDCQSLVGYQVNDSLEVAACCQNGVENCDEIVKTFNPSVSVGTTCNNFPIKFLAVNGRLGVGNTASIDLNYHGQQGKVVISDLGSTIEWRRN